MNPRNLLCALSGILKLSKLNMFILNKVSRELNMFILKLKGLRLVESPDLSLEYIHRNT
jgi:hypothetical protein